MNIKKVIIMMIKIPMTYLAIIISIPFIMLLGIIEILAIPFFLEDPQW